MLNDLSTNKGQNIFKSDIIKSLRPYFDTKFIIESAIYAGLTVVITLGILSLITYKTFQFKYPKNIRELVIYCSIGFALGYFVDFVIYKTKPLGKELDPYYKEARAGLWGAVAFIFAILISYFLENNLIPLL